MTLSTDTTALQILRMINAPRPHVYAALTDGDAAVQWWGTAGGVTTEELILEVWRGGRFRWLFRTAEKQEVNIQGKYRVIEPLEKIIHTWQWIGAPEWKDAMSIVTIEFWKKENDTMTELRLTQEKLPNEQSRDFHINLWNNVLDRLEHIFTPGERKA